MKSLTFGLLTEGKRLIRSNIDEIQNSSILKKYGFFLSLIHFFTFAYWFFLGEIYNQISKVTPGICQPFLQFCESFRFGTPELWRWILVVYFGVGLLGSLLWLRSSIRAAYWFSFFTLAFKFFVYAQDYRLMGNYHYIHFIFILLFLLVPKKSQIIPFFVVLIYLGAGILKLNTEWVSGSALYGDIGPLRWIPIQWATVYVVILELFFSSLLLSKKPFWRKFAIIQFFIFHIYSIQIVGLYYPAVMFCILSFFVLTMKIQVPLLNLRDIWQNKVHRTLALIFIAAQIYPILLPGKSALTGEGRLVSLNMFDARAVCRHSYIVDKGMNRFQHFELNLDDVGTRIRCEPYYYLEFARRICEDAQKNHEAPIVDFHLESRLSSEKNFRAIVDQRDVCRTALHFNPLWSNSWIEKSGPSSREISPWIYQSAQIDPSSQVFMYRGNSQRTGVVDSKELIHPLSRPFWRKPDWNDSRHSASKSSPISDGNLIFAGSDKGFFGVFDMEGKEIWRWTFTADRGIHGTALVVGDSVFWGDYEGVLYSANKRTGKPNWVLPLGQTIGSSPLYDKGSIYIAVETFNPPDGFVAKIDAKTGELQWKSTLFGEQAHSSPALSEDGKLVFVGSNNGYLNALDTASGKIVWRYSTSLAIKGTPLVAENSVFFCSWDKNLYRLKENSGELIWNTPLEGACQSSPTWSKAENAIYISTSAGKTAAFDFSTGKEKWFHQGTGVFFSSPVLLVKKDTPEKEELIANCFENELCIFNSKDGKILRRVNLKDRLSSVPWINDKGEMIYTLDSAGGLIRWK